MAERGRSLIAIILALFFWNALATVSTLVQLRTLEPDVVLAPSPPAISMGMVFGERLILDR